MVGAGGALAAAVEAHAGAGVSPAIRSIGCSVAAAEVAAGAIEARADDGAPGGDVEGAAVGVEGFARDVELFVFVE